MSFEAIRSPKDILQLQNNIESVFVSNILERRRLAIGEALAKAKHVKDIPRLIESSIAVSNSLDFVWQQGLFAGIQHAEKEIQTQISKKTNFSLSYGFTEIIEFAKRKKRRSKEEIRTEKIDREVKEIDGQIERSAAILRQDNDSVDHLVAARQNKSLNTITDQDRQDYRDELTSEIQEAIERREKLLGEAQALSSGAKETAKTKKKKPSLSSELPEESNETSVESEHRKKLRREQAKLRRAWEKRDKAFKKAQRISSSEPSEDIHDVAMSRLGLTTQREITNTFNNRYSALSSNELFKQAYLNQRQSVLAKKENSIIQEDVKNRVADFVAEYKTETNQKRLLTDLGEMYRGSSQSEYSATINTLNNKKERLRRENELTSDELFPIQKELAENEEDIENTIAEIRKRRRRGQTVDQDDLDFLRELRSQRSSLRRQEKDLRSRLNKEEDRLDASITKGKERRGQLETQLNNVTEILNSNSRKRIFEQAYPGLPKAEQTDKMFGEAKKLLRKRAKDNRGMIKQLDKSLSKKEKDLANGDFAVSRTKGKTTQLSEAEQAEIIKLLKLTLPEEIDKLKKPLTSAALDKLSERLKRRRDVFSDESAAQSATRLAVTEVSAAYNIGRLQAFLENGIEYVQWISTIDSKTSTFCQSLHRRVFLLEDILNQILFAKSFPNTRKVAEDPINQSINPSGLWVPPAHPYCRSYLQPVYLKRDEQKINQDIKDEALANQLITSTEIEKEGLAGVNSLREVHNKKKTKLLSKAKVASTLFNSGLNLLLRRLKQDKIANLTAEKIKKDDRELVAALLGGAAALSATSMVYFFLKGNLSNALTEYAQHIMSDVYEGGKEFLAGMTKREAAEVVSQINNEIKALPPSLLEEFKVPLDLENLKVPEFEIDKLAKRGEAGFGLAMEGIPLDEATDSLISSSQLKVNSGKAFKNKIYKEVLNKTTTEISSLRRQGFDVINEGLGDLGIVGDINDIEGFRAWPLGLKQEPSLVYVQPKPGKGKEFSIGAKRFNEVLGKKGFNKKLDAIGERANQLEKVLRDLDDNLDSSDVINKSRVRKALNELGSLSRLSSQLRSAKAAPLLSKTRQALDQVFDEDILTNQRLNDFNVGIENISDAGNEVIKELADLIPPDKVINLVAENITDLSELKSIDAVLDASINNIKKRFIIPRQEGFRVRQVQNLRDLDDSLSILQQVQTDLVNTSAQLEFQPTLDRINEVVKREVSAEYTKLLKQKLEVSRRIKQLEP